MKKLVLYTLFFVFFVLVASTTYIYYNQTAYASRTVSALFGTSAKIGSITWKRNGIVFENVVLDNPPGSTIQTAFSSKAIDVVMDWNELLAALFGTRTALIKKIYIHNPLFGIEFLNASGSESNWKRLLENGVKNYKPNRGMRAFHVQNVTLNKVDLEVVNKDIKPEIEHPSSIDQIEMGQVIDSPPTNVYRIMHAIAKISVFQIASALHQNEFRDSINEIPILPVTPMPA